MENPVAIIPEQLGIIVCHNCGTEWDSRDEHVFSENGHYCIECIDRLDTHANRMLWVECNDRQPDVVAYYLGTTGWRPNHEASCAIYGLMQANLPQYVDDKMAFDDVLHDYVHEHNMAAFRAWLMEQN